MRDARLNKLAGVLVDYSTRVKPGQVVRISGDPVSLPLIEALVERVLGVGGHPMVRCVPDSIQEIVLEHASEQQLEFVNPLAMQEVQGIDVAISIWAENNTKALSRVDPARQSLASRARKPVMTAFMQRAAKGELKWCGTQYPTAASAQDAEMSLRQYEDFVFGAGGLNDDPIAFWKALEQKQQRVRDFLQGKREVHFQTANGTDLRVNVEGMNWVNCCGHENFPDGEVFTGPNLKAKDGGANGVVRYSFPAVHHGREVQEIELTFEKGRVASAKASKNEEFLHKMLDQDEGARFMGEIALGCNYQIQEYTRSTLFDEKIGGTFHAAVGAGYPETGNANESGLHWDMVCDLRQGGTIRVDGEVISKDGRFVLEGWPG